MSRPVEIAVWRLDRRLSGPRRLRRDMVAEIRRGLGAALLAPATALLLLASGSVLAASLLAGARCLRLSAGRPPAASGR